MRPYAERREARIERLRERAADKAREARALQERANTMASVIPMGQPIIVGHYSEGRDRRYRARINSLDRKAGDTRDYAADLARRADAAEDNDAISSDDPEAVVKLRERIAEVEAEQAHNVAVNKAVRSQDPRAALAAMGVSEATIAELLTPDFAGRIGIPGYRMTNNGSNLRRLRERLEYLEQRAAEPEHEPEQYGDVRIEESENRVRVYFPGKPSEDVRSRLKSRGFRWSPSEGAWQRMASPGAWYDARSVVKPEANNP